MLQRVVRAGLMAGLLALMGTGAQAQEAAASPPDQTFGDWVYQCAPLADGKTACSLNQTLVDQDSRQALLRFTLGRDTTSGNITLVALLPLGLDFGAGVTGAVDDKPGFQYGLRTCVNGACIAVSAVDATLLAQLKAGTQLRIGFKMLAEQQPRVFAGSLKGITAATQAAGF